MNVLLALWNSTIVAPFSHTKRSASHVRRPEGNMRIALPRTFAALLATLAGFAAPVGLTQEAEVQSELQEVIVTATKREESLQEVPLSITALTSQDIVRQGIENFADFSRQVPGLIMNTESANQGSFTIRGINASPNGRSLQAPVSIYIDELPYMLASGPLAQPDLRLYDIDRVEVLRGPQGTLFGSGSLAGAVRIITTKPELDAFSFSAGVDFGVTDGDALRQRVNGTLNVPIIDDELAVRLVGYYRDDEGYVDNIGTGTENSNTVVDQGMRGSLLWEPSENFRATLMAMYADSNPMDKPQVHPSLGRLERSTGFNEGVEVTMSTANLVLEYDFAATTVTSSTAYAQIDPTWNNDISTFLNGLPVVQPGPGVRALNFAAQQAQFFTQELRLTSTGERRFDWVVGGFYMDADAENSITAIANVDDLARLNITGVPNGELGEIQGASSLPFEEMAAFGELSFHITPTVTLTGGLRHSSYEVASTVQPAFGYFVSLLQAVPMGGNRTLVPGITAPGSSYRFEDEKVTGKLSLSYQPSAEHNFYALIASGYRIAKPNSNAGQPSNTDPNDILPPLAADPDSLVNYELGMKSRYLENRLSLNVAAYYIPWDDIQVEARRISDTATFYTNVGKAVSKGVEIEAVALPTDRWELGLTATVQEAKITEISQQESFITGAVDGVDLFSPQLQYSVFGQYTHPLRGEREMYLRVDGQHLGGYEAAFPNVPGRPNVPETRTRTIDGYENFNMSFGLNAPRWEGVAYCENAFNATPIISSVLTLNPNRGIRFRPRTCGLRFVWRT
jgi:iron complex outermembrane recepter protein